LTPSGAFVVVRRFAFGRSILDDPFGGVLTPRRVRTLLAAAAEGENEGRNGYDREDGERVEAFSQIRLIPPRPYGISAGDFSLDATGGPPMKRALLSFVIFGMLAVSRVAAAQGKPVDPTLYIGDAAPPLSVKQWVQGEPVKQLDKGTIYVVEFWATWCGPCVQAIPHLSQMQERYKDKGVVFIGIDSLEPDGAAKVPPFVARMGKRMNYRVAVDDYTGTEEGRTYLAWEKASGQEGLPGTFVVGRDGRIARAGYAMSTEQLLARLVAGTFDPVKEFGSREAQRLMARVDQTRDPVEANRIWDEAARLPQPPPGINSCRMSLLENSPKKDVEAAYRILDRAVAAPGARMSDVLWPAEKVLNGWGGPPPPTLTPTGCLQSSSALPPCPVTMRIGST
jgi:thiol-disulfide isomerase/thioredoxin